MPNAPKPSLNRRTRVIVFSTFDGTKSICFLHLKYTEKPMLATNAASIAFEFLKVFQIKCDRFISFVHSQKIKPFAMKKLLLALLFLGIFCTGCNGQNTKDFATVPAQEFSQNRRQPAKYLT
jgi:hypothetical protein